MDALGFVTVVYNSQINRLVRGYIDGVSDAAATVAAMNDALAKIE